MPGGDYGYQYYTGQCSPLCQDGCTGPEASDCMSCVKNAHRNPYGVCACNKNYYGDTCEFFYIGKVFDKSCHPRCRGCIGQDLKDCIECIENAHKDIYGYCMCDEGFYGSSCMAQNHFGFYDGPCDTFCDNGCTGPNASDCVDCV
jgi:hypothetical protein